MMISKDVSWMDEGFYTCMAGNTIGETVSQVNLPRARAVSIFKNEKKYFPHQSLILKSQSHDVNSFKTLSDLRP